MSAKATESASTSSTLFVVVGSALVSSTLVGYLCYQRGKRVGQDSKSNASSSDGVVDRTKGHLGPRGFKALSPPIPYLNKFIHCLDDLCDAVSNPQGHIALCVAENKLAVDLLANRCYTSSANAFVDPSVYTYNNFLGLPVAREAAAYFLARRFLFPRSTALAPDQALSNIQPKHVALSAGCAALINHLFFLLGTANVDCCLIPKPYYAAFESDMGLVAGIKPWGISQEHPMRGPTVAELQTAYDDAQKQGYRPKFVLLTNPNNPLGTIYSPTVLREIVDWARARDMHTIVDEIYALTTQNPTDFESIIHVLNNDLRDDVHMVWAISKDFSASGVRVGLVYSKNELLMEGIGTMNIFSCVSGPIQYLMAELLTDDDFVDRFLLESRQRLRRSYEICTRKLEEMVIPFCPASAGMFVYVDMSGLLPEKTFAYEAELLELMFKYARVVLTPGESQRENLPGMFRICYAWVSPDVLEIALERLSRFVAKVRRLDWNDLGSRAFRDVIEY